jgi:hypothetical protein
VGSANDPIGIRRVVVAGDVTMDWNLARGRLDGGGGVWSAEDRTEVYGQLGGAALLADLIEDVAETLRPGGLEVEVDRVRAPKGEIVPGDPRLDHSFAVWSRFPRSRSERARSVWRVEEFLGLDRARDLDTSRGCKQASGDPPEADLVVLDDADLGFRASRECWPKALPLSQEAGGKQLPWVLLKMAQPVAQGELWKGLLRDCAERLVVVMTLDDLRLSEVKISRELSWERTAGDLAAELIRHPAVNGLVHCAHVVVSLQTGGAVLLSRRGGLAGRLDRLERPDCYVIFDPEAIENSWAEQHPGAMIGSTSCLAAGIARELLLAPDRPDVQSGVRRGLSAARALHLRGYGGEEREPGRAGLVFPARAIAEKLATEESEFELARIEQPTPESWTILAARYPEGLETVAQSIAREGIEVALKGVPLGRFGNFVTVDRGEIEGSRSIRALIREYDREPVPRPLSIAVFGPPGAGKSFGVKAVAKSTLENDRIESLEFNLSQMNDPSDLADALHQVRDAGLRGKLPFVLWDEFDGDFAGARFGWLRHFLAPMQDGSFQQGQIVHPIGKAIFVFAGGTSARLEDFTGNRSAEFRLAKGPDFVSRLKGHIDVVGPDPRSGDPEADPYYRLRRAILLRAILLRDRPNLFEHDGGAARLKIDAGVLRAFLEVGCYRHGARSLETVVSMSVLHGKSRFERSALPAAEQLDAHVDAREFLALVERYVPEGELLERLAEAVHVGYCADMLAQGYEWGGSPGYLASHGLRASASPDNGPHPSLVDYPDLPADGKEQNRGNARDLAHKLLFLGCSLREDAPAGAPAVRFDPNDPRVERLAKSEHERWLRAKLKAGWRYGKRRDDEQRVHPCVCAWEDLPEDEKQKDRLLVLEIPAIVTSAGMTLARVEEQAALKIGISGHRVLAEPERLEAGIEQALRRIEATYPGRPLKIFSALAEGTDRLALGPALNRPGSRLVAVLPLEKYDYLSDFGSSESKDEFLRLLARADELVELPAQAERGQAYEAAGDFVREQADLLLAVWDGQDEQGQGGTATVIAQARERRLPIAWVHAGNRKPGTNEPTSLGPEQGTVTYENFQERTRA